MVGQDCDALRRYFFLSFLFSLGGGGDVLVLLSSTKAGADFNTASSFLI